MFVNNFKNQKITIISLSIFLATSFAFATFFLFLNTARAETNSEDLLYGETLSSRGMSVSDCPNITSEFACLINKKGDSIYERNAYKHAKIASLTKIMTAVVAIENSSLDKVVEVSKKAYEVGESSAGLWPGDKLDLKSALYAMLVPSGNDSAQAILKM